MNTQRAFFILLACSSQLCSPTKVYDQAGRTTQETVMPGGLTTKYTYHANGQIGSITHPDGRVTTYTYDARGRKTSVSKTGAGSTTFTYDARGDLTVLTDPLGNSTRLVYDNAHRAVQTILADGRTINKTLDDEGRTIRMTDPKGQVFNLDYFANGRRKTLSWVKDGQSRSFAYAYDGNQPVNDGALAWTLDEAGRVKSVIGPGVGVTYTYDHPLGLLTRKSYAGVNLDYTYDDAGRLNQVRDGPNSLTYTERTPGGLPKRAVFGNGLEMAWQYDGRFNVAGLSYQKGGQPLAAFTASYDGLNRRTSLNIAPTGENFTYAYNGASRLASETRAKGAEAVASSYTYDLVGNRLTRQVTGSGFGETAGAETYSYNSRYMLTSMTHADGGASIFAYDANGNISDGLL